MKTWQLQAPTLNTSASYLCWSERRRRAERTQVVWSCQCFAQACRLLCGFVLCPFESWSEWRDESDALQSDHAAGFQRARRRSVLAAWWQMVGGRTTWIHSQSSDMNEDEHTHNTQSRNTRELLSVGGFLSSIHPFFYKQFVGNTPSPPEEKPLHTFQHLLINLSLSEQ